MKLIKLVAGISIEIALIVFVVKQYLGTPFEISMGFHIPAVIAVGIFVSNIASCWIVDYLKNEFLWKKVGPHPDDPNQTLRDWWIQQGLGSTISLHLGVIERVILVCTGLLSFQVFFAAAGAWTTIKIAVDWQHFKGMRYRVIGHIYLISTTASLLLAAIDVAAARALLGMSLLGIAASP